MGLAGVGGGRCCPFCVLYQLRVSPVVYKNQSRGAGGGFGTDGQHFTLIIFLFFVTKDMKKCNINYVLYFRHIYIRTYLHICVSHPDR